MRREQSMREAIDDTRGKSVKAWMQICPQDRFCTVRYHKFVNKIIH